MRKWFLFLLIFWGILTVFSSVEAKVYLPNASGFYSQWFSGTSTCTAIGGTAAIFSEVNEYPINNGDTNYNCTDAATQNQSYNLENSSDSGTINSVKVVATAKLVSGSPTLTLFFRLGASETLGTAQTLTAAYAAYSETLARPGGGSWTTSDITSLEAGFRSGGTGVIRVTQLFIDVAFKTETNRVKFHILQEISPGLASGGQINQSFSFTITDPIDEVRNAFIEIKGVVQENLTSTILRVGINDTVPIVCNVGRVKCYTLNSAGRPAFFRILYDVTNFFKDPLGGNVRTSGGYTFTLNIQNDGPATINISSGKLIITYTWIIPPVVVGAFAASGTLTSVTYDTGAVDGATYNSIHWLGTLPAGTSVKFQLATSNVSTGPFDFIGGATCSVGDFYNPGAPDTPIEITCAAANHNNQRYFRYKVQLCSSDCVGQGSNTPIVEAVIVNYSP